MFSCSFECTFQILIRTKIAIQISIPFHIVGLGIQGHSTGVAVVVVNPVVAINMEPVVVEIEASSPDFVASLPHMHCRFTLSVILLSVAAVFYNQKYFGRDKPACGLGLTQDKKKK